MRAIFIVLIVIFGFGVEGTRIRAIRRRWIQYPDPTPNVVSTKTQSYSWQSPVSQDGKVIYSYTNPGGIRLNLIGRNSIATTGALAANLNQYATNVRQPYPTQYSYWYPYQVPLNNGGSSGYLYESWQNGGGPIDISINNGRPRQKNYNDDDEGDNDDHDLNLSLKDGGHSEIIGDSAQSSHSENGQLDPLLKYGILDEDRDAQIASNNQRIILVEPQKENRDAEVIVQDVNDDSINNEDGRSVIGETENGQIIPDTDGSDTTIDIDNEENIVSEKDTIFRDDEVANSDSPTERNEVEDQHDQVFVDNGSQSRVAFDIVPDGPIVHNQPPETLHHIPSMPAMSQYNAMPQMPQYNPAWSPVSPIRPPPHVIPYNAYNVPPNQVREPGSRNFRPLVHPVAPNVCPSRTNRARSLLESIQENSILPPRHNYQNVETPYVSPQNNIWNNKRPYYYNTEGVQDSSYRDRKYWYYYNNRDRFGVPFHTVPNIALGHNQFNPAQIRIANDDPSTDTPKVEESPILLINPDTGKEDLIAVNQGNDYPQPASINIIEQLRARSPSDENDVSYEQMQDILNVITSDIAMFVHSPCYHGDSTSLVKELKTVIHSMNQQQCTA